MYVILKDLIETNKMQKNIVPSLSYDFLNRDLLVITLRAKPENRLSGVVVSLLSPAFHAGGAGFNSPFQQGAQ